MSNRDTGDVLTYQVVFGKKVLIIKESIEHSGVASKAMNEDHWLLIGIAGCDCVDGRVVGGLQPSRFPYMLRGIGRCRLYGQESKYRSDEEGKGDTGEHDGRGSGRCFSNSRRWA